MALGMQLSGMKGNLIIINYGAVSFYLQLFSYFFGSRIKFINKNFLYRRGELGRLPVVQQWPGLTRCFIINTETHGTWTGVFFGDLHLAQGFVNVFPSNFQMHVGSVRERWRNLVQNIILEIICEEFL